MKNHAIVLMASFYLLLTTGMFVCMVNCSTKWLSSTLVEQAGEHQTKASTSHEPTEKSNHCTNKKDCSCCKKHGNYFVKESLKPNVEALSTSESFVAINKSYSIYYPLRNTVSNHTLNRDNAPPPGSSGPGITILYCSFLI